MARFRKPAILIPILIAGCLDAQGNRMTMQQWWESRGGAANKNDSSIAGGDEPARASPTGDGLATAKSAEASRSNATSPAGRPPPSHAIVSDVLLVNDETISVNDILEPISTEIEKLSGDLPPPAYYREVADLVRRQIIEAVAQHLIWRNAKRMIDEEMETRLTKAVDKAEKDRINREFRGRETVYDKYLTKHGKTRAEVRERLRRSIIIDSYLRERLLPLVPAPRKKELLEYYNAHHSELSRPQRRQLLLIDVPVAAFLDSQQPRTDAATAQARAQAREVVEEAAQALRAGEPFADVAKRLSRGPNADKGGDWGLIEAPLKGRWEAPSKRLFEMREGEQSEVIETPGGLFIVRVGQVEAEHIVSFEEAQPEITNALRQRKFAKLRAKFLQDELSRSTIGSLDDFVAEVMKAAPRPQS